MSKQTEIREGIKGILRDRSINIDLLRIGKEKTLDDLIDGLTKQILEDSQSGYSQALKDVKRDLSALLKDATDLRDLERKLVGYNETLKPEEVKE